MFKYKIECFEEDLRKRIVTIPEDDICEPPLMIAGPTLEALKYTYDEQELREMFINLLASSMNRSRVQVAHPAFVEIIRQLSSLDAKFLNLFRLRNTYPGIAVFEKHSDGALTPYLANIIDLFEQNDAFSPDEQIKLTMVLDNLGRLGLLKKSTDLLERKYDYDSLQKHWIYSTFEKTKEGESTLISQKYRIEFTELGRAFKQCCL